MKKLAVSVALFCAFMAGCGVVEAGAKTTRNYGR